MSYVRKVFPIMAGRYCTNCGAELKVGAKFCTECGTAADAPGVSLPGKTRNTERIRKTDASPKAKRVIIGLFALIVLILVYIFINFLTVEEHGVIAGQTTVGNGVDYTNRTVEMIDIPSRVENGFLIFSVDDVRQHELIKVEYQSATATVPVLAYISPKGRLVTAISISEPCNATRFTIIDNAIKCNNCPANWELNTMKALACCPNNPPDPIPSQVIGNEVRIAVTTLEQWRRRL
jgi:uncharacterized protein